MGVEDLDRSVRVYGEGLGLEVLSGGLIEPEVTAGLWGFSEPIEIAVMGRESQPEAPRLRLMRLGGSTQRPSRDTSTPGPLGVGFTTQGIEDVYQRTERFGVEYLSAPIELTPEPEGPTGPRRFEVFGQSLDGEFVVLIERQNVDTPYGTISETSQTSEPLHTSHVVPDLAAASRFMCVALDHEVIFKEECDGPDFEQLMAVAPDTRFRFEMLRHPDHSIGRIIFIQYDEVDSVTHPTGTRATKVGLAQPPGRGINALRYDCTNLDSAVARAERVGGALLRPVVNVEATSLGAGRVAPLASPAGILIELWEPA